MTAIISTVKPEQKRKNRVESEPRVEDILRAHAIPDVGVIGFFSAELDSERFLRVVKFDSVFFSDRIYVR